MDQIIYHYTFPRYDAKKHNLSRGKVHVIRPKMKLLITGSKGQLAMAMAHSSLSHFQTKFLSHEELNIGDAQAVNRALVNFVPDIIINTAAYTAVDVAEKNAEQAFYANEKAVSVLASVCAKENIPLIHFSTDYVFDGEKTSPYLETDAPNPKNIYGMSKYKGEEAIREVCEAHIILRVSSLFSLYGNNFVKTILKLAQQKNVLNIVSDQLHCPTSAHALADVVCDLIRRLSDEKWGTYHYCGDSPTTWYGFCEKIFEISRKHHASSLPPIHAISSLEYGSDAQRPSYSVLSCDKILKCFGIYPNNWLDDLERIVPRLL